MDSRAPAKTRPTIAVVGPCAAGKSTLVDELRRRGYDAYVCGQEHSEIQTLWQHGNPDVVIALDVDLATVRRRRGSDWPATLYDTQLKRLESARAAADVIIDAARLNALEVLRAALRALER